MRSVAFDDEEPEPPGLLLVAAASLVALITLGLGALRRMLRRSR